WGDDYQESNGRVAEQKQLQLKAIHRPRLKSGSRQQREQTTETHGAGWRWMQQYSEAKHRPVKKRKPSCSVKRQRHMASVELCSQYSEDIHRTSLKAEAVSQQRERADDSGTWRRVAVEAAVFGSHTQA
ncbi:unnamed protein product, partial [Staurois parvus]